MLSAIIVNHRSHALINRCLRSLLAGTRVPDEMIVVDSEGSGGGLEADLAADDRIRLVSLDGNPGYAAACNTGVRDSHGDVLLFMNADVLVSSGCVERCLDALATDESVGIVSPSLRRPDGRLDHACHRGLPTLSASIAYKLGLDRRFPSSRRLARYTMAWLDPTTDHDVEACSGALLLIARSTLHAVGGWDERYRFYAEDLDLCVRVGRLGLRVRYLGTVTATHLKGAFSHHRTPDRALDPSQRAVKRWVRREINASHRLFFEEHLRAGTWPPTRVLVRLLFALQSLRIGAADRLAGA